MIRKPNNGPIVVGIFDQSMEVADPIYGKQRRVPLDLSGIVQQAIPANPLAPRPFPLVWRKTRRLRAEAMTQRWTRRNKKRTKKGKDG